MSSGGYVHVKTTYRGPGGRAQSLTQWIDTYARELPRKVAYPALRDASSRTVARTQTRAVRRISKASQIPAKLVRARIRKVRGKLGPVRNVVLGVAWYRRGVSLPALKAKQTKTGVRAGKHVFPHAFLAVIPANQQAHGLRRRGSSRLPVDVLRVEFKDTGVFESILSRYATTFMPRRFRQQVARRIQNTSWGAGSTRA